MDKYEQFTTLYDLLNNLGIVMDTLRKVIRFSFAFTIN
jgi:hypothetical protein